MCGKGMDKVMNDDTGECEGMMFWHEGNQSCEGKGYFSISFDIVVGITKRGLDSLFTSDKESKKDKILKVHVIHELIGAEFGNRQMVKFFPDWKDCAAVIVQHGLHWNNNTTGKFQRFEIVGGSNHDKTILEIKLAYLKAKEEKPEEPVGLGALFG